jgi:MFS family permease
MVKEMITEKKFHNRAFMLLPMTFNIGVMIGPMIGGYLSEPVDSYPWLFGPRSWLGGEDGIGWMAKYPYALPNVISAFFLGSSALSLFLFLKEVSLPSKWRLC